jgi:hypothetical protein
MTQVGDDLNTRQLNMLTIRDGRLYHSTASEWSEATNFRGNTFMRFKTETAWANVGDAVPISGYVTDVAAVAGERQLDVFIVTIDSHGTTQVIHTLRRQSDGAWSHPKDVLAESGINVSSSFPVHIAAGVCPKELGSANHSDTGPSYAVPNSDVMIVLYDSITIQAVRVFYQRGFGTRYISAGNVPIPTSESVPSPPPFPKRFVVRHITVATRPFPDSG